LGEVSWTNAEEALEGQEGKEIFCDQKEATAYFNDVCPAGSNLTSKNSGIRIYSISPPVFDAGFEKAAIIVEGDFYTPGSLGCSFAAGGEVYVLTKNGDRWEKTYEAQLYTAD